MSHSGLQLVCNNTHVATLNTHSFMQIDAHTICLLYSFFPHVTSLRNTLPNAVTSAPSIVYLNILLYITAKNDCYFDDCICHQNCNCDAVLRDRHLPGSWLSLTILGTFTRSCTTTALSWKFSCP